VYWRYRAASLSVFIFPLVFLISLVASLSTNVTGWPSRALGKAWLYAHIVFILLGYAALLFTAVAAVAYLFQERELKRKKPRSFSFRLPPLGTLDEIVSSSLDLGFLAITVGIIIGSVWACVEMGTRWITDPRIVISFVTWGIYLALIFFRRSAGWRGRKAAILAIMALFGSVITWATHVGIFVQ
jgi:ABC-type transport system involved in cytochrome c biogenesis permease subunit